VRKGMSRPLISTPVERWTVRQSTGGIEILQHPTIKAILLRPLGRTRREAPPTAHSWYLGYDQATIACTIMSCSSLMILCLSIDNGHIYRIRLSGSPNGLYGRAPNVPTGGDARPASGSSALLSMHGECQPRSMWRRISKYSQNMRKDNAS
jgi:hypothetical protein